VNHVFANVVITLFDIRAMLQFDMPRLSPLKYSLMIFCHDFRDCDLECCDTEFCNENNVTYIRSQKILTQQSKTITVTTTPPGQGAASARAIVLLVGTITLFSTVLIMENL